MKTKYFTDIKLPIYAGMEFTYPGTKFNKIKKIGHTITRLYFDSPEKDMQISQKEIKRILINGVNT